MTCKLAPSILSADFANLQREVERVSRADMLHVDVMDGHFVPNFTIGPPVVACLRRVTTLHLDVHLMITNPLDLLEDFLRAGADGITVHRETVNDDQLEQTLKTIRRRGKKAGLTLRPSTPLDSILPFLELADIVLVMSVEPGFGGVSFIPDSLERIRFLHGEAFRRGLSYEIEVDGGIKLDNVARVRECGAGIVVVGSAIFGAPDPQQMVETFRAALV